MVEIIDKHHAKIRVDRGLDCKHLSEKDGTQTPTVTIPDIPELKTGTQEVVFGLGEALDAPHADGLCGAHYALRISDLDKAPLVKADLPEVIATIAKHAGVQKDEIGSIQAVHWCDVPEKDESNLHQSVARRRKPLTDEEESNKIQPKRLADEDLRNLVRLNNLRDLNLDRSSIADEGMVYLRSMPRLMSLHLSRTKIGDGGLHFLAGLRRLEVLDLSTTRINGGGLEYLKGLTRLQVLDLRGTKITDAGLEQIKGLTRLQELALSGTKITDAGLEHLKGLTRLRALLLDITRVTEVGMKHLRQALPNCTIRWSPVVPTDDQRPSRGVPDQPGG